MGVGGYVFILGVIVDVGVVLWMCWLVVRWNGWSCGWLGCCWLLLVW